MDQFQVWVDLKDERYAKRLIEFLKVRYGERMVVQQIGSDQREIQEEEGIWLTDKEENRLRNRKVIWVSQENGLNPYQSGHLIARKILEKKETGWVREEPAVFGERNGQWISVFSPVGGIGKSTLAMGLAEILAKTHKVLFLSMEGPSAWNLFYSYPMSYNLSDFFYCFLIDPTHQRKTHLEEMVCRQDNGVEFMPPCVYPDDLMELAEAEIEEWMRLMKDSYDYVVADLSSQLIRPYRMILAGSDRSCFVLDQRGEGRAKWQDFKAQGSLGKEQWFFCRHGEPGRNGMIDLPEEVQLFDTSEGKRRFRRESAYYQCLKNVAEQWI